MSDRPRTLREQLQDAWTLAREAAEVFSQRLVEEIERADKAEAEVRRLRKALAPFADAARGLPDDRADFAPACHVGNDARHPGTLTTIRTGAFRAARRALEKSGE